MNRIIDSITDNPIIAAVRKQEDLSSALETSVTTVFLLGGDIFNIKDMVDRIKDSGKCALIHIDLLEGIGKDHRAIDYIKEIIRPDGIITTKSSHVKYAKESSMFVIQRFFLVDSQSYETAIRTVQSNEPDMIEIMPGIMPDIVKRITAKLTMPVIAGGLIDSKDYIIQLLQAGAMGVSAGMKELWVL
jgi:glycerol uptake operon antiterminator